jgi:hypothetical protein
MTTGYKLPCTVRVQAVGGRRSESLAFSMSMNPIIEPVDARPIPPQIN